MTAPFSHLLWLYSPTGVGPGQKSRRKFFFMTRLKSNQSLHVLLSGCFLLSWSPYAVVSLCESLFGIDVESVSLLLVSKQLFPVFVVYIKANLKQAAMRYMSSAERFTCICVYYG